MRKYIVILILFFVQLAAGYAQQLKVISFEEMTNDLAARTNLRNDLNGNPCALVKVRLAVKDASFKGMVIGDVKYEYGEYHVYMPEGAKKIMVSAPDYLPLDVNFGEYEGVSSLKGKVTYQLTISNSSAPTPSAATGSGHRYQYIVFNITPKDAMLELDGEALSLVDGTAMKYVPFGQHTYKVELSEYHSENGSVDVSDPDNKKIVDISLKPAFGWVNIPETDETKGAKVYIDNKSAGTVPVSSYKLASGQHSVKVIKDMYKPFETTVTIEDSKTNSITPSFMQNFSNVALTVEDGAEIWINGERKGTSRWSGQLAFGNYLFETKKDGHRNGELTKAISSTDYNVNLNLPKPTPIYGSLKIEVEPALSKITIDGKNAGESPLILDQLLIGSHRVKVLNSNFSGLDTTIVVKENEQSIIKGRLAKITEKYIVKKKDNKYGMVDQNGNVKIDFIYDDMGDDNGDLIIAKYNGSYGFIDRNGETVIPFVFDDVDYFSEGYAKVKKGGKYGFIDKSGEVVIPIKYDGALACKNGYFPVKKGEKWGFESKIYKRIKTKYYDVGQFVGGLAPAMNKKLWGYINAKGKWAIKPKFTDAGSFNENLASVCINGKYGFIDKDVNYVIPCIYDKIDSFEDGIAYAIKDGKMGTINMQGKEIIPCVYDSIGSFENGIAIVHKHFFYGMIDKNGKEIVPCEYGRLSNFNDEGITYGYKYLEQDVYEFGEAIGLSCYEIHRDGSIITADKNNTFEVVNITPIFPGGNEKFVPWLSKNLKYPASAQENGTQGRVICKVIIDKDGSIVEPKVIKSVDPALDKEAIRVISGMPRWEPAKLCGKAVRVRLTIPVTFRLQ